jgi:hypothetical protein
MFPPLKITFPWEATESPAGDPASDPGPAGPSPEECVFRISLHAEVSKIVTAMITFGQRNIFLSND